MRLGSEAGLDVIRALGRYRFDRRFGEQDGGCPLPFCIEVVNIYARELIALILAGSPGQASSIWSAAQMYETSLVARFKDPFNSYAFQAAFRN